MNRNPFEQMKALRERRARDRAEQEQAGMPYDAADTQPVSRYLGTDVTQTEQQAPSRRRRPLVVGLAAGAVAGAVLAFSIPAIASGMGGSPRADVSSATSGHLSSGGGGSASAAPTASAPSGAPDTSAGAGAKPDRRPGKGVCPRPHPRGPDGADRASGNGHRPPAPSAAGKGHRPPTPPGAGKGHRPPVPPALAEPGNASSRAPR